MALSASERDLVKQAATLITREAAAGEKVILRDFGTFSQVTKKARTARNPKTGASIEVPAKSVLKFKPSAGAAKSA